ncbi:MAG: chromosome segregation protein SMC [Sphaerobacteraceae bacterium]|nr:MAG: chromosome segregation protein SMC [Sphaerobacteraceae bacterium]
MTVRIKRLELNGFKSFPRPTVFEFDSGITAIIGPNGSGKSNIADGMRWVLGEQSYSNLRGRKADDVIFAGSTARSAVGMAEVTLTLDNSSGDMPIEFQEVSITRRAYRSGENQYLINGSRVRLKDVNHITAAFGQSHTVIGQGLVDAALSQRPEERRGLFEHAAGITGLRMKYAATSRHLAETTSNSTRLEDLLNELEPRLKTLERQAKQAREFADVQRELRETTLRYYSSLWRTHQQQLRELNEKASSTEQQLEQATRDLASAQSEIEQQQTELETLQQQAQELDQQVIDKRASLREQEHQIDLTRQRQESLRTEINRIDERQSAVDEELSQIEARLAERTAERETLSTQLAEIEDRLSTQQQSRQDLDRQINEMAERQHQIDRERETVRQRIYQARAEHDYRLQQQHDLESRAESISQRRSEIEQQITTLQNSLSKANDATAALESTCTTHRQEISRLEQAGETQRKAVETARQALESIQSARTQRSARLDALQRLQESGEGLHRGVQAILDATKSGKLSGIIGTLASQITVSEERETAVEAALGGHLQDIIVERWSNAEAAIELLKRQNAGRATFQPLDTQRNSGNQDRPSLNNEPGVHGIAVDLIEFSPEMEPVLNGLIGRTVITDDLPTTRKILNRLRPGWTVVTLDGEVTRSGGSVTGGSRIRQSGTLSRERELRDLPVEITELDRQRDATQAELDSARSDAQQQQSDLDTARTALRQAESQLDQAKREQTAQRQQLERAQRDLESLQSQTSTTTSEAETRAAEIDQLVSQAEADEKTLGTLDQQRASLMEEIDQLRAGINDADLRVLENDRSRIAERLHGIDQQTESDTARQQRLMQERQQATAERARIEQNLESLAADLQSLTEQIDQARVELESLTGDQGPLAKQRDDLQASLSGRTQRIQTLQQQQRELERARDSQRFDIEREQAQGAHLVERVIDILEIEDPVPLLDEHPIEDDLDMPKLESSLHRLRQRARRIGAFGEETITQYEQEQERYTFLRSQLDDVQSGAEALHSMLKELEQAMADEFDRTFGQVAEAFQSTFHRLFGGGSAQLVRSENEEDRTGIDIVAQPPGKKLQSLALLSGGERALTAVALLFAIQRVNPSPFCLLDEVDAALDESNVVRFRDELRDLAARTQFVIVTHNRATIEGSDVLYGITMGTDAISRVVSLKLPDEAPVPTA